jgi:hypothetical protein
MSTLDERSASLFGVTAAHARDPAITSIAFT